MFDEMVIEALVSAAEDACAAPVSLATVDQLATALKSARGVMDRLDGLEAMLLQAFDEADGPHEQGASSTAAWARQHLRLDGRQARARVRAGRTLCQLPQLREASRDGTVRLDHIKEFAAGITKAGLDLMADAQDYLVPVAQTCDPAELRGVIHQLVDVVHPERLDQAWVDGMEKNDVKIARVGDGFHLTGFLDPVTGAQFKCWLDAAASPKGAEDERMPNERRIDAVRDLVSLTLEHGLPSDRGVRLQVHVLAELETLLGDPAGAPAELTGFGPIGPELLDYLRCASDLVPILVHGQTGGPTGQANVLNVGQTRRLATPRQRIAVRARQHGVCANPGCRNTHLEVHHADWWKRDDGKTDLNNLVGLCPRCHHLVHCHLLNVKADGAGGFVFSRGHREPLEDHWRQHRTRIRRYLRRLRRAASGADQERESRPSLAPQTRSPIDRGWPSPSLPETFLRVMLAKQPRQHRRQ